MNLQQFDLIATLLEIADPIRSAARDVILNDRAQGEAIEVYGCPPDAATAAIDNIRATELSIRGEFVHHNAAEWEVVVGHNDHHRRPGNLALEVGQTVWLICRRTYLKVPVRVTGIADTPSTYHRGVIESHVESTRYAPGDSVSFGDEQAETPTAPVSRSRTRKPMAFV